MDCKINIKKVILPGLLLSLFLASCAYFNTFYNAETAYQNGYEAMRQEERERQSATSETNQYFREAVNKGRKILEQYGDSKYVDDAYLIMGKSYYYLKQYTASRDNLSEMLEKFPDSPLAYEARLFLGKAYLATDDYVLARHTLEQLVEDNASKEIRAQAYLALADLNQAESKGQEMLDAINKAINVSNDREIKADAAWRTAQWAVEEERYADAEKYYREAAKFTRKPQFDRKIDFEMTQLFRKSGEYDQAREQITLMLANEDFQDFWPDLEVERGLLSALTGDTTSAVEAYKYVTANYRNTSAAAHAFYLLGETNFTAQDYSQAKTNYQQVARADRSSEYTDSAQVKIRIITNLEELQRTRNRLARQIVSSRQQTPRPGPGSDTRVAARAKPKNPAVNEPSRVAGAGKQEPTVPGESVPEKQTSADRIFAMAVRRDSLPEQFDDYVQTIYRIAEIYIFDLDRPAVGLSMADTVAQMTPDREMAAKTRLLQWFAYEHVLQQHDQANSLRQAILQKYGDTESAQSLEVKSGQREPATAPDILGPAQLYRQADSLIIAEQYRPALDLLHQIHRDFPQSRFGAKALYARGWIYENRLMDLDSALATYTRFQAEYPHHNLNKRVNDRIEQLQAIKSALASGVGNTGSSSAPSNDSGTAGKNSLRAREPAIQSNPSKPDTSVTRLKIPR